MGSAGSDSVLCSFECIGVDVCERDIASVVGEALSDPGAHRAGSEDDNLRSRPGAVLSCVIHRRPLVGHRGLSVGIVAATVVRGEAADVRVRTWVIDLRQNA